MKRTAGTPTGYIFLAIQLLWLYTEECHSDSVSSQNTLAGKLYNVLAESQNENIFFSPFSINYALTSLAFGSTEDTLNELQTALSLPKDEGELRKTVAARFTDVLRNDDNMTIANRLFVDNKFQVKDEYLNDLKKFFGTSIGKIDLKGDHEASRQTINHWVEEETKNIIKDLMPAGSLTTDTVAVLVNAVYFKSEWIHPFNVKETHNQTFYGLQKDYQTDMMVIKRRFNYKFDDFLQSHLVILPYKGNYRMLLAVPKDNKGITDLETRLKVMEIGDSKNGSRFIDSFMTDMEKTYMKLSIPKFKLQVETPLKDILKKIGVQSIFKQVGQLKRISDDPNIFVSDAFHKANINVDETSTEAAAGSGFSITSRMGPLPKPKPVIITADHPFIFAVQDKITKTILFVGRLSNFEK